MTFFGIFTSMLNAAKNANSGRGRQMQRVHLGGGVQEADRPPVEMEFHSDSDRPCPECGRPMGVFQSQGVLIDHCGSCHSYWFDVGEVAAFTGLRRDVPDTRAASRPSRYRCSICDVQMIEYTFRNPHNLLVDRCPQCLSVYMEAGEFQRAMELSGR